MLPDENRLPSALKDQKMVNCHVETLYGEKWLIKRPGFSFFFQGGTGTPGIVVAPPTPFCLDYSFVDIGVTSTSQFITVTSSGTLALVISSVTSDSADFVIVDNGCTAVAPGGYCQIEVAFSPTVGGPRTGIVTIVSNAGTKTVCLTGFGTPAPGPYLILVSAGNQPGSGNLNNYQLVPVEEPTQIIATSFVPQGTNWLATFKNIGDADYVNSTMQKSGDIDGPSGKAITPAYGEAFGTLPFALPFTIPAGTTRELEFIFNVTTAGTVALSNFILTSNATNSPFSVDLQGVVGSPAINVTPTFFNAGDFSVAGGPGPSQIFTIHNTGTGTATINGFLSYAFAGDGSYGAATQLDPGANTTAKVVFDPVFFGPNNGSLELTGNFGDIIIPLTGNGI